MAATSARAAATGTVGVTAKILSGLSAGIGAANTSFSKNFLQEQAITLLTARADALRDKVRAGILTSMQQTDLNKYSLGAALMDVQAYARAGSLVAAAAAIQSDNGTAKTAADVKLDAATSRQ